MFFTHPRKNKSRDVLSRDIGGHSIGPPLPSQHLDFNVFHVPDFKSKTCKNKSKSFMSGDMVGPKYWTSSFNPALGEFFNYNFDISSMEHKNP